MRFLREVDCNNSYILVVVLEFMDNVVLKLEERERAFGKGISYFVDLLRGPNGEVSEKTAGLREGISDERYAAYHNLGVALGSNIKYIQNAVSSGGFNSLEGRCLLLEEMSSLEDFYRDNSLDIPGEYPALVGMAIDELRVSVSG